MNRTVWRVFVPLAVVSSAVGLAAGPRPGATVTMVGLTGVAPLAVMVLMHLSGRLRGSQPVRRLLLRIGAAVAAAVFWGGVYATCALFGAVDTVCVGVATAVAGFYTAVGLSAATRPAGR